MNLVDAAAEVLRRAPDQTLSVREIAERAMAEGLITPKSQTPWIYMAAAMRKELRQLRQSGRMPRFELAGDGRYRAAVSR
jgi:hypothetical protein